MPGFGKSKQCLPDLLLLRKETWPIWMSTWMCSSTLWIPKVLVKVNAPQCNYLEQLPLHHTQKVVDATDECTVYEYRFCAEYEFQHELMRMGESIEVPEPGWLRHQIRTFAEKIVSSHQ